MDRNRWIIFIALCLAVFGILIFNKKSDTVDVSVTDPQKVITKPQDKNAIDDHVFGAPSQKVVLMEYGDFQCPGCGAAFPKLKAIKEHYKDQLTFVFRHFPLTSIHPNALVAASAAESAGLQGKFWEYHDKLYESQNEWSGLDPDKRTETFISYAKELGLNEAEFKKHLEDRRVKTKVKKDQALGKKQNVQATPTVILNGTTIQTSQLNTQKSIENLVRDAIKQSGQTLPDEIPEETAS
jgi:protein-disulfide isomerase